MNMHMESSHILDIVVFFVVIFDLERQHAMPGSFLLVGLVPMLCLTVSPVRSTDYKSTRQARGITCDNDVVEKPLRLWQCAVQQLADAF